MKKNIFVYGTLKQGKRNHYHFEDKVIDIVPGTINASIYHLDDFDCPSIKFGDGVVQGEIIYYDDTIDNRIELAVDKLEQSFDELYYDRRPVTVTTEKGQLQSEVYVVRGLDELKHTLIENEWN